MALQSIGPLTPFITSPKYWGGSSTENRTIDASGEKIGLIFHSRYAGTLVGVDFRLGTVTTGQALRVSVQDVTGSSSVPDEAVDDSAVVAVADSDDAALKAATFSTGKVLTYGQAFAIVIEFDATIGNLEVSCAAGNADVPWSIDGYLVEKIGGTWTRQNIRPWVILRYSDGTITTPRGFGTPNSTGLTINTTPDEMGCRFVPLVPMAIGGAMVACNNTPGDYDVVLYNSSSVALAFVSVPTAGIQTGQNGAFVVARFADVELTAGAVYRLVVKPTSTTSCDLVHQTVSAAADLAAFPLGTALYATQRTDGGAWTDTATRRPCVFPIITKLADDLGTSDTTPPLPAPEGYVSSHSATSFVVTLSAVSGEASTTLRLQTRGLGSNSTWTTQASDVTPAVGDTLTASGLTESTSLEWRIIEEDASGNQADGTHGIVTPASSLWSTLTATIATALEGQGLDADAIYVGRQPEPNYPDVAAVLRTTRERVRQRANNVEQVEFPVDVELRVAITDDDGDEQKEAVELWQRRLEATLHEKHAGDFPGVAGLEEVTVEVLDKDARAPGAPDEFEDEIRARAVVRFLVWRAK